jgi:predicted nuclease with TOPRIM domain
LGNKENDYSIPDSNRMMINMANEFNNIHKEFLKQDIKNELIEILMEKLQEMVKQNIQNQLKECQDITNRKLEKTQKQLNELTEDFNKLQSETKETLKKR